jgi:hypothetical protein
MNEDDEIIHIQHIMPHVPKWTEEEIEYFKWGLVKTGYMTKEEIEKEFGVKIK